MRSATDVRPLVRPLKVYAFDPSLGKQYGNEMTVSVAYEPLAPGPRGSAVAVIDYDASNRCYYPAVDLEDPDLRLQAGVPPSEADPHFHQQMAYAVATRTIETFSTALGRQVRWHYRNPKGPRPVLRVFPHAMPEANAFYDPDRHALFFGYFQASQREAGTNLPGQTIYTCLSHDIVAHETSHALLHDLRPHYLEASNPDTLAFHEAFADLVALFQHFSFREALIEHITSTAGLFYQRELRPTVAPRGDRPLISAELARPNVLIGLAQQFGEALEMRAALRGALGTPQDPQALARESEPHARGAILVACIFDAFFTAYLRRSDDLVRLTQGASGPPGARLAPELARRLTDDAAKTAGQFLAICVRAIDYCPPVDITFGDFLRALITVDSDLVQEDSMGYRAALIEAFRGRGVCPGFENDEVASYAEESLRWKQPKDSRGRPLVCPGLHFDVMFGTARPTQRENARLLHAFGVRYASQLKLDRRWPIQAAGFHPVYRVGQNGQLVFQVVAQLLQKRPLPGAPPGSDEVYRGGCTLVIDLPSGVVRYAVHKRIASGSRLERQQAFREEWRASVAGPFGAAEDVPARASLARLHRGY